MAKYELTVRGFHLDIYQHVNNARYLEYLEEARWQFFDDVKIMQALGQRNLAFVLANTNINYRQPALMNQRLVIDTHFISLGNKSCKVEQIISLKDDMSLIVDAQMTFVLVDSKSGKPQAFDDEVRAIFQPYLTEAS